MRLCNTDPQINCFTFSHLSATCNSPVLITEGLAGVRGKYGSKIEIRLVLYPSAVSYTVWQGVLIAFVCTCDVSVAVYGLINVPKKESSLLLFGKKLLNLAAAIPAAVMAHVAPNACTALPDGSYWDRVFGILAGTALSFMGVFMMLYTRRHKKYYENKNDIA